MFEYIGEDCIVCKQKFKEGDDIVVCPDCGTPYHRDCYKASGSCINLSLHENHKSWSETVQKNFDKRKTENNTRSDSNNSNDLSRCPNCGNMNRAGSDFCSRCGKNLNASSENTSSYQYANSSTYVNIGGENVKIDFNDKYAGMNPNDEFDGAKIGNTAEFIGSNKFMLLVLFKKFTTKATKISTNIACLFFPYLYFAYRKMWKMCFAFIAVVTVLSIPTFLDNIATLDLTAYKQMLSSSVADTSGSADILIQIMQKWQDFLKPHAVLLNNLNLICNGLVMAMRILAFLFGNYLYYKFTVKKVKSIQNEYPTGEVAEECRNSGGTSVANVFLGIVAKFIAEFVLFGIIAVILLMNI